MEDANAANQYEQERRAKRDALREIGADPYGSREENLQPLLTVKNQFTPEMGHDGGPVVKVAGRVMLKRDMGKLSFITLRDDSGDLQIALDKKRLDEAQWKARDLIDLGDQIVIEGNLGQTNKGETTVWAKALRFASKALLPPPAKWEGLSDVEARYRQRYVDLWANPDVMRIMKIRMRVMEEIRAFMRERGFAEVETPMMQIQHGGAAAKPFKTHHNALDMPLYLRIAPELFLKRLLVGGFTKIFELNRNFRNEGISPRHNPEFTMLEAYEAYGSWETMAELVESMICRIAERVFGTLRIRRPNAKPEEPAEINLEGDQSKPIGTRWPRVRLVDLVEEKIGWRFDNRPLQVADPDVFDALTREYADYQTMTDAVIHETALKTADPAATKKKLKQLRRLQQTIMRLSAELLAATSPEEQLQQVYEKFIEPKLIHPVFVTRVPKVVVPLARECRDDPFFADVYELAMNGIEISPGYTEQNDPDKQREHFMQQVGDKEERQAVDEDFLTALKYGMPPAGGMGMGIDRLVMTLTGAESLRDVILFPLMKPQVGQ